MFMCAHAVNDGFMWIMPPLLPMIREYFHLTYGEAGALLTLFRFFGDVFQAPAAYLVHLAPVSGILVAGLLWSSVGMFLSCFSPSYVILLWLSSLSGIGRSTYHPLAVTMLSRLFDKRTFGRVIGFHLAGSGIGMVAAPFLVGFLVASFSWRIPLQVWSLLGVLVSLALYHFLKHEKNNFQAGKKALAWPFVSRSLVIYLAAASIWALAQSGVTAFLPLFLVDRREFSAEKAAMMYGVISFAGLICKPLLGALMDRMGRRKPVVISGYVMGSLSILILALFETSWVVYLAILLMGLFVTGHAGLADTFMVEMVPSQRREETLGFIYTLRMGIGAVSPFLVGLLSESTGLTASFLYMAGVGGLAILVMSFAPEKPAE
jgi:MFS family permease